MFSCHKDSLTFDLASQMYNIIMLHCRGEPERGYVLQQLYHYNQKTQKIFIIVHYSISVRKGHCRFTPEEGSIAKTLCANKAVLQHYPRQMQRGTTDL